MTSIASTNNPFLQLPQRFDPSYYHGSQAWVDVAVQSISSTPTRSMELIGLPGMGKSFLLRYLADPAGALLRNVSALQSPFRETPALIFPVLVEFRLLPSKTHPFVYLFKRFRDELNKVMQGVTPLCELPVDSINDVEPNSSAQATALLEDVLLKLNEIGMRTAFLFDDFHIAFELLTQEETTRLRPWREASAFILTTERRLDKVNSEAAGSPFFQTLQVIPFGGLSIVEARRLMSEPAEDAEWPFAVKDIQFALERAAGHPLLLILAGRAIWDARNALGYDRGSKAPVSTEFPAMLIGQFKEWFFPIFKMYWEHLDPEEHVALSAAAGVGQMAPEYDRALAFLDQLGLVKFNPKEGNYEPFSSLLSEYLREGKSTAPRKQKGRGTAGIGTTLFDYLQRNMSRPSSFEELGREVWGERSNGGGNDELLKRRIQVAVSRLRKKLHKAGTGDVLSVRDQGYRLVLSK